MERTVRRGYASRIVAFIVRSGENSEFLKRHGLKIHDICGNLEDDLDVPGITAYMGDVLRFLQPTLNPLVLSLEGIQDLFGIIKSSQDQLLKARSDRNNWGYPPEMITALRFLCAQGKIF